MINFALGFVAALVVIQFVPRVGYIGVWIVAKAKSLIREPD